MKNLLAITLVFILSLFVVEESRGELGKIMLKCERTDLSNNSFFKSDTEKYNQLKWTKFINIQKTVIKGKEIQVPIPFDWFNPNFYLDNLNLKIFDLEIIEPKVNEYSLEFETWWGKSGGFDREGNRLDEWGNACYISPNCGRFWIDREKLNMSWRNKKVNKSYKCSNLKENKSFFEHYKIHAEKLLKAYEKAEIVIEKKNLKSLNEEQKRKDSRAF